MVQNPNYTRGQGRLVTDRFDFEKHVNGTDFNHESSNVTISPAITIDGYARSDVHAAIQALTNIAYPPTIVDASGSVKGIIRLSNDLGGTAASPTIVGLQNIPVLTTTPYVGEVLTFNGVGWSPEVNANTFVAGGDLTGDNISQIVSSITGTAGIASVAATSIRYNLGVVSPQFTQENTSSSSGTNLTVQAQTSTFSGGAGGNLILSGGARNGAGIKGGVKLQLNASSSDTLLQVVEAAAGRRVVGLFSNTITGTQVTSGDMVMYVADTTTPPTTDPSGGIILYSEAGIAKVRQGSSIVSIGSIPNPSTWGPTGAQVKTSQHTFTTTNASPTNININPDNSIGFTLTNDSTTKFDVIVVARRTDSSTTQTAQFNLSMGYVTVGSTPTDIGTVTSSDNRYTTGADTWTATIDRSSNIVRVRVTGEIGKTINWFVLLQATIGS